MKERYLFKGNLNIKINKSDLSRKTEISYPSITNIINCKITTNKAYAFIITKFLDKDKNIEDYFIKI